MDVSRELFEMKNRELAQQVAEASLEDRPALLEKLNALSALQRGYERTCAQFEALFSTPQPYIDIDVTDGAISESYLNLREAVSAGLVIKGRNIRLSFPGLSLEAVTSDIKRSGYLHSRTAARRFYELTNLRQIGRTIRFTRVGPDEYTLEALYYRPTSDERPQSDGGRLPNFRFSMCNIQAGETIAFIEDPSITCVVYDDRRVLYNGRPYYLSALAQELRGRTCSQHGPHYFSYRGEPLNDIRGRMEGRD